MLSHTAIGYVCVIISVCCFGSYTTLMKTKAIVEADIDPMVYQINMNLAIFLSSWWVLIWYPLYLEPWAVLSAALWFTASILSIFAVNNIGMSIAAGIWCGTSMFTSFLWGVLVFEKEHPVKSLPLSILALAILILGTAVISLANRPYFARLLSFVPFCKNCSKKDELSQHDPKDRPYKSDINQSQDEAKSPLLTMNSDNESNGIDTIHPIEPEKRPERPWVGVLYAVLTGIPNGSMMAPMNWAPKEVRGLPFAVSFGIAILATTPLFAAFYFAFIKQELPRWSDFKVSWWRGMLSGLGWNIGNVASMVGSDPAYLGMTIAFPLAQCEMVVAGFWGLLLFKELKGLARISHFVIGATILLGGAVLLSLFGG